MRGGILGVFAHVRRKLSSRRHSAGSWRNVRATRFPGVPLMPGRRDRVFLVPSSFHSWCALAGALRKSARTAMAHCDAEDRPPLRPQTPLPCGSPKTPSMRGTLRVPFLTEFCRRKCHCCAGFLAHAALQGAKLTQPESWGRRPGLAMARRSSGVVLSALWQVPPAAYARALRDYMLVGQTSLAT